MKVYEFLDRRPAIGKLVVIEGTERVLAELALEALLDDLLPAEVRDLNLAQFKPEELGDMTALREALQAMPFLAQRRVVVVSETHAMRADPRRELFAAAQTVPEGNTLVLVDLLAPRGKGPPTFGSMAGRAALRVDTTADEASRERFVRETLARLGATAQRAAIAELARSPADLTAVRNDLEKLAAAKHEIALADLAAEALAIADPKGYVYAQAVLEGRIPAALRIAHEMFEADDRAAMALLSALAVACKNLWELARPGGGNLVGRDQYSERALRPLAPRFGERRARVAYERALVGMEAIVTGRAGNTEIEKRTLVERLSVEIAGFGRR